MDSLLIFVHVLSLVVWNGGLVFLFVVVTPTLYRVLSDDLGLRVVRQLLPAYYSLALASGVSALASLVAMNALRAGAAWFWWRLGLLLAMNLLTAAAAWGIQPRVDAILRATPDFDPENGHHPASRRLIRLQKLSMQVNGSVLLLGLTTLWLSVGGPQS